MHIKDIDSSIKASSVEGGAIAGHSKGGQVLVLTLNGREGEKEGERERERGRGAIMYYFKALNILRLTLMTRVGLLGSLTSR